MPFISRLKNLGTLPVPELQTTLNVYLINLEHSQETNIVYTSFHPIAADASPPAHLHFDCPDIHTKPGDVLIWASRVRKKACYVHACWVFDGQAWVKPSSDSEVMMDHPEHPDYQLVILSGPYVKWELKPDPDREPSLTIPDPPPVRPGARGTMNTIIASGSTPVPCSATEDSQPQGHESKRSYEHTTESRTPDGSAVLCGSSFSSPIPESLGDNSPESTQPQNEVILCNRNVHASEMSNLRRSRSPVVSPSHTSPRSSVDAIDYSADDNQPKTFASFSGDKQSPAKRIHERSRGARASPSSRQVTPAFVVPPTPNSMKVTRSRSNRSCTTPYASLPPSRRLKRSRSGTDGYVTQNLSSLNNESLVNESLFPVAKRRKLDIDSKPRFTIRIPPYPTPGGLEDADGEDDEPNNNDSDDSDDSDYNPSMNAKPRRQDCGELMGSRSGRLHGGFHTDLIATRLGSPRTTRHVDSDTQLIRRYETPERHLPETPKSPIDALKSIGDVKVSVTDGTNIQDDIKEVCRRDQDRTETAVHQVRQLQADLARSEAALAEEKRDSSLKHRQLKSERDRVLQAMEELKALVEEDKQTARLEAKELTLTYSKSLQEVRHLASTLSQTGEDLRTQLSSVQSDKDSLMRDLQARSELGAQQVKVLEETKGQLEEQRRRASNFEGSLRVAQEALQRQRTHAQETESRQEGMIAQLVRQFQEKDTSTQQLVQEIETLRGRIGQLESSVSTSERALADEKENAKRAEQEIARIVEATQGDRLEVVRLNSARVVDERSLISSKTEILRLRSQIDQLQREGTVREAALAAVAHNRRELEKQTQELQKSIVFVDHQRQVAEGHLQRERDERQRTDSQLRTQLTQFEESLALADKERGRLEQLLLERRSSLQLDLKSRSRDLESLQTEYSTLKAERITERDKFTAELASCQQSLTKALEEQTQLKDHLQSMTRELEEARLDCTSAKSSLSTERERFKLELTALDAKRTHELSASHEELAKCLKEQERVQNLRGALEMSLREQSHSLKIKHAEYTHLKAHLTSERDRFAAELTTNSKRLERQLEDSKKELATVRAERTMAEDAFQAQHASLEKKLCHTAAALADAQVELSKQTATFQAERQHFATEIASARKDVSDIEERLVIGQKERIQVDEVLARERDAFKDERERSATELASTQKYIASLKTQLSVIEKQRSLAEELLSKEQAVLKEERANLSAERSTAQKEFLSLEQRLSDANSQRTQMVELFSKERADFEETLKTKIQALERERINRAKTLTELADERQRVSDLSSTHTTLEEDIDSYRSRLALVEEKGKRLEAEIIDLRSRSTSATTALEASQAEYARLKSELAFDRERFQAERNMSPESLRGKLASVEACLEHERNTTRTLREELATEQSSNYWSDLGSQLLRSLHEVQDQLKVEQTARQAIQYELILERSKHSGAPPVDSAAKDQTPVLPVCSL